MLRQGAQGGSFDGRGLRHAAERFLDWSATGGGLKGLDALGKAVDAANVAADRLTAFGKALEGTTCPG